MLEPGQRIDNRYEVEALIGQGGLAEVYRVRHIELGSVHALKLLLFRKKSLAERLLLEGRIQAQLRHPNVVSVTDVVRHDGQFGLLMEYVDNVSLDVLIDRRGALPVDEALELIAPVIAGVHAAHQAGVLHRDLKPANVLLARTRSGAVVPKVSDFGIAKVVDDSLDGSTREGVAMGTPGYMAPEQVLDARSVDVRTDVFALAAIFYELVSGRRAFADDNGEVSVRSTLEGTFLPLHELVDGVDKHVSEVIGRALSRDRDARYEDVSAFATELLVDRGDLLAAVQGSMQAKPISLDPTKPSLFSHPGTDPGSDAGAHGPTILPPETAMTYAAGDVAGALGTPAGGASAGAGAQEQERRRRRGPPPFWTAAGLAAGLLAVGAGLGVLVAGPSAGFTQAPPPTGEPASISAVGPSVGSASVVRPDQPAKASVAADGVADGAADADAGVDIVPASPASADPRRGSVDNTQGGEGSSAGGSGAADLPAAAVAGDGAGVADPAGEPDGSGEAVDPTAGDADPAAAAGGTAGSDAGEAGTPEAGDSAPASSSDGAVTAAAQGTAGPADTPPVAPPAPALVMPMDTFVTTSWDGRVFRQPFALKILRERSGEVWAEGRIVLGANQRILPMVGRFDPASGRLFLRESNGDLILEGVVSDGRIKGTYKRSGKDKRESLDLVRR